MWTESSLNKIHNWNSYQDWYASAIYMNQSRCYDPQENYHAWLMIDIDNQYTFYRHIILTVMLRIKMWIKYSFSRHKVSVYLIDLYLRLQSVRYVTCFQSLPLPVDARMMVVTAGLSASYCPQDRSVSLISGTRRVRVTGGGVTPAPAPSCSLPPPPPHLRPASGVWWGLWSSYSH